ncbi:MULTISPECIES: hypothetical protein [Alteromonadaceae]|uniref:hypothetical protein n=1 Tax=Alteromonadaceae TaxID=72275 RepID=UPI001C08BBF2|nr:MULTISPECIES: hypothetical protein [Aliiglaciecola]MBU2877347.1 hypothetical protein [Aliiglaciecola lipolytica]MDO6712995.1 hypothetical protein [Aliiglaciecola sp. 2_MG-2023]MDO6754034.1 hypothetical protein [Aliiglaciecola sp. 1_MG-2023]
MKYDLDMSTIIGIKPMKASEVVKIHQVLDGFEPNGVAFEDVLKQTKMDPVRLRELLDKYHFYFTEVGDSSRYIVNRYHYDESDLDEVIDSIERRNVRFAIAKFTPFFLIGLVLCSATIGFMLSAIVNKNGGYW